MNTERPNWIFSFLFQAGWLKVFSSNQESSFYLTSKHREYSGSDSQVSPVTQDAVQKWSFLSFAFYTIILSCTPQIKLTEQKIAAQLLSLVTCLCFFPGIPVIPLLLSNYVRTWKHTVSVYFSQGFTAPIFCGMLLRDIGLTQSKLRRGYS